MRTSRHSRTPTGSAAVASITSNRRSASAFTTPATCAIDPPALTPNQRFALTKRTRSPSSRAGRRGTRSSWSRSRRVRAERVVRRCRRRRGRRFRETAEPRAALRREVAHGRSRSSAPGSPRRAPRGSGEARRCSDPRAGSGSVPQRAQPAKQALGPRRRSSGRTTTSNGRRPARSSARGTRRRAGTPSSAKARMPRLLRPGPERLLARHAGREHDGQRSDRHRGAGSDPLRRPLTPYDGETQASDVASHGSGLRQRRTKRPSVERAVVRDRPARSPSARWKGISTSCGARPRARRGRGGRAVRGSSAIVRTGRTGSASRR